MESITIGQIAIAVTFITGLITGLSVLTSTLKKWMSKTLKADFDSLRSEVKALGERIDNVDMNACKNFLVRFLADVEHGNPIDEVEKMRFYEQYSHYSSLGGNSYIKDKVEKLRKDGKL